MKESDPIAQPASQDGNDQPVDRLAQPVGSDNVPPRLPFAVVGLGASAGGLEALNEFFGAMPPDSGMAFVVVQHLPPDRESLLAEILSRQTAMPVHQIEHGLPVQPNHVYVIKPGRTLTLESGVLKLGEQLQMPRHRRPVDDFFRSLAAEQRERAICVVLSGMGSNGSAGAGAVKAVGGVCIAQEPETAKFPSMPRHLIELGLADFILRPKEIPPLLTRYASDPYTVGSPTPAAVAQSPPQALGEVLAVLRSRTRHDFSGYKKPTLVRRIQRRMGLTQSSSMEDYLRLLRQNPPEAMTLADDLMIHVTGFFRDEEAWEALRAKVIVRLMAERAEGEPIRCWVTACSSGEEAYTLAILLLEAAEGFAGKTDIKIFATDTANRFLAHARNGVYPGGIESELSPERLERFFDKDDATYRIKKQLREMVVFAPQNLMQDPPFSRLDICTCRNLLIYLNPEVQRRVLAALHFGVREGGALFLGSSETIASTDGMFEPIDKKHRIFRRVGPTRHGTLDFSLPRVLPAANGTDGASSGVAGGGSIPQLAGRILLNRFTPPSLVVDRQQNIVYFHGHTEHYLDQPRGEPTRQLMALLKESVRGAVRKALLQAVETNHAVAAPLCTIERPTGRCRVETVVVPLEASRPSPYFMISFVDVPEPPPAAPPAGPEAATAQSLNEQLLRMRDDLQNSLEEVQTSNDEMKASNEEICSINEELQSTNEELETGKEELQSLNEELTTANAQLQNKMEELEVFTNDLSSLLSSTDIAVLFLDMNFRIRRFTPATRDLVELIPSDIGRPLNDLAWKFKDPHLQDEARAVLEKLVPVEREIISESGRTYIRRSLPYRTNDNRIAGVVLTFVDITLRKQMEATLRESEQRHRLIIESVKDHAIVMLDPQGRIATWTSESQRLLGYSPDEAIGRHWSCTFTEEDRANHRPENVLEKAKTSASAAEERWCLTKDDSRFWCSGVMSAVIDGSGELRGFVKVLRDMTEHRKAEEELRQAKVQAEAANDAKDRFLANVSHELRTPLSAMLLWASILEKSSHVSPDELREALAAIRHSAEAQRELVEDLLDTSRISAGQLRLDLRPVDLAAVIQAAVGAIQPAARAKRVRLQVSVDPAMNTVRADPHRLQQVVWNLLTNAVKFTPEAGQVVLSTRRLGDEVEITVADTGRGISQEFLGRVFDRFGQADSSREASMGGLGLGLTISRQLVVLHGGQISADSAGPGRGATFTVRLPLPPLPVAPEAVPMAFPRSDDRSLQGLHVLLAEDDVETRKALTRLLHEMGATVSAQPSVAAAIAEFQRQAPDVIVSDIGLPDGDGYALLAQARAIELRLQRAAVPAVALTAYALEKDRSKAQESGFEQFLTKPVEPLQLIAALTRYTPPAAQHH